VYLISKRYEPHSFPYTVDDYFDRYRMFEDLVNMSVVTDMLVSLQFDISATCGLEQKLRADIFIMAC
jgi:hypothetical protein